MTDTRAAIAAHLQITDFQARFVSEGEPKVPWLVVRSLRLRVAREGLLEVMRHFAGDIITDLTIEAPDPSPPGGGVDAVLRVGKWGVGARIRLQARLLPDAPGDVRVIVERERAWAPGDWALASLVRSQLLKTLEDRPEVRQDESGAIDIALNPLASEFLAEQGAPMRWNAMLARIEAGGDGIEIEFQPV
jgi:hypothetical protein